MTTTFCLALGMERRELYYLAAARGCSRVASRPLLALVVATGDVGVHADRNRAHRRTAFRHRVRSAGPRSSARSRFSACVVALRVLAAWRVTRATANARVARRTPMAVRVLDRDDVAAHRRRRHALRARSGTRRRVRAGVDERARRDAHDRAARRAVVVPVEPPPPARHAASLRVELDGEERRAGPARSRGLA